MAQKQVFAITIESAFLRGMKGRLSEPLKKELRALDLDLDAKLKPAYPLETYVKGLKLAVQHGFPGLPKDEAYRKLGEISATSMNETTLGKLLVKACALMGPHRVLAKAENKFRTMGNYLQCVTKPTGPTSYEMWLSEVGERAMYFEGVVRTFLIFAGAKNVQMKVIKREGESATFSISWTEGAAQ